ncbi:MULTISPECIES: discoidin domain-containing protein [Paenibacillus]|uniref:discoidin domain-containing protein n=1 Tax=Paenibacillus TaxID=44249 RepID=UPI002FE279F8
MSSSIEGMGFEAGKAFDGNLVSRWASNEGTDPEWIYVDLGSVQSVSGVKLKWEDAHATQFKIQVSSETGGNPVNWTDVATVTNGDGGEDSFTFAPQNARYVRMYGTQRGTSYGYSLYEFEVYGEN